MADLRLGVIVEGFGEVQALPIILRRLATESYANRVNLIIPSPVRAKRHQLAKIAGGNLVCDESRIRNAVEVAARNINNVGAILLMLDADEDPACILAPKILQLNLETHGHLAQSVVLPVREFEAWYVGAAESLAGYNGIPDTVTSPQNPEDINPKSWLTDKMGRTYAETVDQAKFAARFDMVTARRNVPSFDKLCRDFDRIVTAFLDPQP